jgi:hypothetical protein
LVRQQDFGLAAGHDLGQRISLGAGSVIAERQAADLAALPGGALAVGCFEPVLLVAAKAITSPNSSPSTSG